MQPILVRRTGVAVVATLGLAALAYALYHRTDAYRHGNRLFYRDGRPNPAGRAFGALWTFVTRRGLVPSFVVALETVGHRTGRRHAIPMVLAELGERQYLVSMLGERSPWVRNVRAADGRAVIVHGTSRQAVRLVEIPVAERAPILKVYVGRAVGSRPHIPVAPSAPEDAFAAIASAYPVFRVDPGERGTGGDA